MEALLKQVEEMRAEVKREKKHYLSSKEKVTELSKDLESEVDENKTL